jgi:starch synthase (maltosyl-transferring)
MPRDGRVRVCIEGIAPTVDGGAHAAKRILHDKVTVSADLISDGHDVVAAELLVRRPAPRGEGRPAGAEPFDRSFPLEPQANDRFSASFVADTPGLWHYAIRGWVDHFATFRRGLVRKV